MPTIDLPQLGLDVRVAGPEDSAAPPVVFVHGFLVDGGLWTATAAALAASGVRSYAPDLPLGSHRRPVAPAADLSPRGVAGLVLDLLAELDLADVTLVGNDTGGAICQIALDRDPARIGRVVLTNCDAFDRFPPPPFDAVMKALRRERAILPLLTPMRATAVRHSPAGYGLLAHDPDPDLTRGWVEPALDDAGIRHDIARFVREVRPAELLDVSTRLDRFPGSATLVWGTEDRLFTVEMARRLRDAFGGDARLVELAGVRTFVPLDAPERLAEEIVAAARQPAPVAGSAA